MCICYLYVYVQSVYMYVVKSTRHIESAAPRGRFLTYKLTMILTYVAIGEII